jgi:hypothetical protein
VIPAEENGEGRVGRMGLKVGRAIEVSNGFLPPRPGAGRLLKKR